MPVIPPLFHESNFLTELKEKAEPFGSSYAKQWSLIKSDIKPGFIT